MKKKLLLSFACLLVSGLTSCGFHLRGATELPAPLQHVYVKSAKPYGELATNIRQYFKISGAHTTETASEAETVLNIIAESTGQQLLGVSGTQQTRQYNLTLSVTFQLTTPDGVALTVPETLTQSRTLPINAGEILSGSNQATALYQQMRRAIVFDIMNRLASHQINDILTKKPAAHETQRSTT